MATGGMRESTWQRAWRDAKKAWLGWRFWAAEIVIAPILGLTIGPVWAFVFVPSLAVVVGGWVVLRTPTVQRNEARESVERLRPEQETVTIEPTVDGPAVALLVENRGASDEFALIVDDVGGLEEDQRRTPIMPYHAPWIGVEESLELITERGRRELLAGESFTVSLFRLLRPKDEATTRLFEFWSTDQSLGHFLKTGNREESNVVMRARLISRHRAPEQIVIRVRVSRESGIEASIDRERSGP